MIKLLGMAAVLAVASAAPAFAQQTLSNNLSASYSDMGLSNIFTHENACGCGPLESSAVVDSFTLSSRSNLTQVQAALTGILENPVSNFTGFANAAGYQVNIYSSAAAAVNSITGDLYSHTFAPGDVSFGAGFEETGYTDYLVGTSLASFAIDTTLSAGTYWLSVVGIDGPDENESIGVALYGSGNAIQTNPAGGAGMDGNVYAFGEIAGYAVFGVAGVPEPASWAMMIGGFGLAGGSMRVRRRTTMYLRAT